MRSSTLARLYAMEHPFASSPKAVIDFAHLLPSNCHPQKEKETSVADTNVTSLSGLIDAIPEVLKTRKDRNIPPGASNDPVSDLLRCATLEKKEWEKYSLYDPSKPYSRNLIATDDETYTLLLLCWNPQQESPIHDHPCDGCWLKVLEGGVRECRYDSNLNCISDDVFHQGALTYITDSIGYHKVGNPTDQQSMSLHLYSPPFSRCRVWCEETTEAETQCDFQNHSEYGHVLGRS